MLIKRKTIVLATIMSITATCLCIGGETEEQIKVDAVDEIIMLDAGEYVGGEDIPVGAYILTCETDESTHGIVKLSVPDASPNYYPTPLYETIGLSSIKEYYIPIEEGEILEVPFAVQLTTVNRPSIETDEEVQLYPGLYTGGRDIEEGQYVVHMMTNDDFGMIWASRPNDDFVKGYPSLFYEQIRPNSEKRYFISMEEGGQMMIPCDVASITKIDGITFDNGSCDLYAGGYVIGRDIPSGKYSLICKPVDGHGTVSVSAPGDDLAKGRPSILYENVWEGDEKEYYFSVEDGGILSVLFECTLIEESD